MQSSVLSCCCLYALISVHKPVSSLYFVLGCWTNFWRTNLLRAVLHFGIRYCFSQDFGCLYLTLAIRKRCKLAEFADDLLMKGA